MGHDEEAEQMQLPKGKLTALTAGELKDLIASAQRELCKLEQQVIVDFSREELAGEAIANGEVHAAEGEQNGSNSSEENEKETAGEESKEIKRIQAESKEEKQEGESEDKTQQNQGDKGETEKTKSSKREDDLELEIWKPPPLSVPVRADVRTFDFGKLVNAQRRATGRLFDVVMTDPPWQLATSNPTRGVAIGYEQLADSIIEQIPFPSLQENGLLFVWVINAKYKFALELMEKWGFTLVDEITWVKRTVNRRLAKSHGFYLQHAKETCLVGRKGNDPPGMVGNIASDIIWSERRGQSQKPVEIYELIEQLVPNGNYLEIFARRNNLRDGWVSIGNEL